MDDSISSSFPYSQLYGHVQVCVFLFPPPSRNGRGESYGLEGRSLAYSMTLQIPSARQVMQPILISIKHIQRYGYHVGWFPSVFSQ